MFSRPYYLFAALTLFVATSVVAAEKQPNVLLIAVDDLRTELGCYGLPYVESPRLDQLAAQGMLFRRHYVQVPTCGASRFALLTGRSPVNTRAMANTAFYSGRNKLSPQQLPGAQTMPELFRRNGYHTVCIGKISHTADGKVFGYDGKGDGRDEMPGAWDELATPYGPWKRGWGVFFGYEGGSHREDGTGRQDLLEFTATRDEDLPDGMLANAAIKKLGELKDRDEPFFLGLGFIKPHLPFVATKQDWDAIAEREVAPPTAPEKLNSEFWSGSGEFYRYDAPYEKSHPLAKEDALTAKRGYLACVRYVDRQIGKVLDEVDRLGLAENTIVVVWGDHGWHLGEYAMWGKHALYERTVRSTLIVRAPGVTKPGSVSDAIVDSIDLYPTLIDLCEPRFTQTANPLDGKSLRPVLTGQVDQVHEVSLSYWGGGTSVRSPTHRLIVKQSKEDGPTVELYDLRETADPTENLAASHPELVASLLAQKEARENSPKP
ncbi:sulfatase [Blastopirellula marina]|uniref:Iduronate-2-sulfatase n=1 Tax=Blastopirellula marina DSM 3645 TaxID=314230 RepID=A3ZT15_9BACT|nr:sulfatase [Blastopirellula marina]EAQ80441.1 iduronate-2-sulfatase [Blastopirellula marina DSM 3645]